MKTQRIVLAGGGSAGHVNPLLATATELVGRGFEVTILGTSEGLEVDLVPGAGFPLEFVDKVPFPRRPSIDALRFPARFRRAVAQARVHVEGAAAVVGFGGYVASPAYAAAKRLDVPVVVHEQNARPGLANRWGARSAEAVAVTFRTPVFDGAVLTGMPIRDSVLRARALPREQAAAELGLDPDRPAVVVSGGSLGAVRLNSVLAETAADIINAGAQILHLTGRDKSAPVFDRREQLSNEIRAHYHVREYLVRMELAYAVGDLVIGRAGAGAVAELTALGIPAIYVPLPVGNGEQRLNAAEVIAAGGGRLISDERFTGQWVRREVVPLLRDPARRLAMAQGARSVGISDGSSRLCDLIEKVVS